MIKVFLCAFVLVALNSCAATADIADIRNQAKSVDLSNGVDRVEAIVVAQNEMIRKGFDKKWDISKPKIRFEDEDEWGIKFYPKLSFSKTAPLLNFLVAIKKKTGEITYFAQDK